MWQDPRNQTMRTLLTPFLLLAATACNSGTNPAPIAPPALAQSDIAINVDNALASAQAGVRGSFDLTRLSYIGAQFLQTPMPEPTSGEPGEPTGPSVLATLLSTDVDGPQGGVATFSWDDLDESGTYNTDDVFTILFANYGAEGMVLNGVMTIDNVQLQGLLPGDGTYILEADLNFLGLSVMLGARELRFTTTLPFRMENRIIVEIFDLLLLQPEVVDSFEVQEGTHLVRYETDEIVRFQFDGAVHSAELEGIVRFETPTYLIGSPFLSDPTAGTLIVNGANRSRIEIEPNCIVPGVCFSLDVRVDADGDEEYEEMLSSSWTGLLPQ